MTDDAREPNSPVRTTDLRATDRLVAIGEIAAEVAHELRNALQIIAANVYLAKQDLAASGPHLAKIERNTRLAQGIVDDLMALARGEAVHAEPVALVDVLHVAREGLAPSIDYDDAIDPAELRVRAHIGLLSRLFAALYQNADAVRTSDRARVLTRASRQDGRVVIDVVDDGPGVPPEIAATLFEPLVSSRKGGTGLGLSLARRIAAAHGGSIALVATDPASTHGGATFRVELAAG